MADDSPTEYQVGLSCIMAYLPRYRDNDAKAKACTTRYNGIHAMMRDFNVTYQTLKSLKRGVNTRKHVLTPRLKDLFLDIYFVGFIPRSSYT